MKCHQAYLIVICAADDNRMLGAEVWSSPEWEQSRYLTGVRTYVAFQTSGASYDEAARHLLKMIADPIMGRRYHWLYQLVSDETLGNYRVERGETFEKVIR